MGRKPAPRDLAPEAASPAVPRRDKGDRSARAVALAGIATVAILAALLAAWVAGSLEDRRLRLGRELERMLDAGDVHVYRLDLEAGELARLAVEQRGADVRVRVHDPGGRLVTEIDSPTTSYGPEPVTVLARRAGVYRVEIAAVSDEAARARYLVRLVEKRPARASDRRRAVGEKLLTEAGRLHWRGTEPAMRRAAEKYRLAADHFAATGADREEAYALLNLGEIRSELGDPYGGLRLLERALELFRSAADRAGEAEVLSDSGYFYSVVGENQRALDLLHESAAIKRRLGDVRGEANVLHNVAAIHESLGDGEAALADYRRALAASRAAGDRYGRAYTLTNLGRLRFTLGDEAQARRDLERALELRREVDDLFGELATLTTIAELEAGRGRVAEATAALERALELTAPVGRRSGLAAPLVRIGSVYERLGEDRQAHIHFERARKLSRAVGNPGEGAAALYGLARIERRAGRLDRSRRLLEAALEQLEHGRGRILSQRLRASLTAAVRGVYELAIDLRMELAARQPGAGHLAAAFELSERARARTLLEILAEAGAEVRRGAHPELIEREAAIQRRINDLAERQELLLADGENDAELAVLRRQLDRALRHLGQVRAEIRRASPWYAGLTQPEPLGLAAVQSQVLDPESLLLEFALGEERSHLWAITSSSVESFTLPGRVTIEAAARRYYALLTERNRRLRFETAPERRARIERAREGLAAAGAELGDMLLAPLAGRLEGRRLLIAGEGALRYIPFAALPAPGGAGDGGEPLPLIARHEVLSLPSASVVALLRRRFADRRPAPGTAVVIADPVFSREDPRLRRGAGASSKPNPASGASPSIRFPRLPHTRHEAEAILRFAEPDRRRLIAGFDAERETLVDDHLAGYRIVHFATHALLHGDHPELTAIVLSLLDREGRPRDGFLRLHDVYNLELDADLVVLSACRTALGQEIRGEGLIGLTRGFMYAGTPRVVAALWDVDDAATAELMERFYRGMLREGRRPAAALRRAQISMRREERWREPYYWAGFVLQGEWR